LQESNPALRLKEEVIAANTLTGTGFSSSGTAPESGEGDPDRRRISIDDDANDGDDIDDVIDDVIHGGFFSSSCLDRPVGKVRPRLVGHSPLVPH
jgi:hypothetical protein